MKNEEQIEKELEKNLENSIKDFFKGTGLKYIFEGAFGAFFTFLFAILLNVHWENIGFLTENFADLLPIINISFAISFITYIILILFRSKLVKLFNQVLTNTISIFVFLQAIYIFPFDFSGQFEFLDGLLKPILIILIILIVLGTFGSLVSAFTQDNTENE